MLQWLRVRSGERRLTSCRDATRAWEGLRERTLGTAFSGGSGANRGRVGRGEAGGRASAGQASRKQASGGGRRDTRAVTARLPDPRLQRGRVSKLEAVCGRIVPQTRIEDKNRATSRNRAAEFQNRTSEKVGRSRKMGSRKGLLSRLAAFSCHRPVRRAWKKKCALGVLLGWVSPDRPTLFSPRGAGVVALFGRLSAGFKRF
eukprot:scaffold107785_cov62-Phaeocystis_antarctica.AAC.2